jgi:hypothetical protein
LPLKPNEFPGKLHHLHAGDPIWLVAAINDVDLEQGLRIWLLCITGDRGMQILVTGVAAKFNNKPMEQCNNKELADNATIN